MFYIVCMYTRKGTGTSDLLPPAKPHSLKVPQHPQQHSENESVEDISDSSYYSYNIAKEWNPEVAFLELGVLKTVREVNCLSPPSPPKSKLNPITLGDVAIIFPKIQETGYPRDTIGKIQNIEKCTIQGNQSRAMGMKSGVERVREEREEEWRWGRRERKWSNAWNLLKTQSNIL